MQKHRRNCTENTRVGIEREAGKQKESRRCDQIK